MYIFVYINKPTYETIYSVEITKNYLVSLFYSIKFITSLSRRTSSKKETINQALLNLGTKYLPWCFTKITEPIKRQHLGTNRVCGIIFLRKLKEKSFNLISL